MMRIIWGLYDSETETIECFFEAENLLEDYREQLLRRWYDQMTKPVDAPLSYDDFRPMQKLIDDEAIELRNQLLDLGYERWRNDQIHPPLGTDSRYQTEKYQLWNSVPPNPERLIVHFDT